MRILKNVSYIGFNIATPLAAIEGVAPYTYSVVSGGAGGSIGASSGVYVAPNIPGVDKILAVDDEGTEATLDVFVLSPLGLLCDVIRNGLGLASDQVYIYNQTFKVPPDKRLYIAVGIGTIRPFSNVNRGVSSASGVDAVQYANFKSEHDINIVSASEEALNKKEEVMMSFVSNYSQRQQAANSFHIAPQATQFTNLSDLEGERIPFRFNVGVNLHYAHKKVADTEYYDDFENIEIINN